jgi:pilus assembly protein CpaB
LKRSNRLILLVGIFLAVVAFVGIYLLLQPKDEGPGGPPRNEGTVAIAKVDIPLGTKVTQAMVETQTLSTSEIAPNAIPADSQAIGKIARQDITQGQQITTDDFNAGTTGTVTPPDPGMRAVSVQVDQVSGVGTLIAPGDFVDMIVSFGKEQFRDPSAFPPLAAVGATNGTTTKVLVQGMRVLGVLLPPPSTTEGSPAPSEGTNTTTLNGQQEIVIVEVDAQQSEIIRFAQIDGSISLALRSPTDFTDPSDPTKRIVPLPDATTGTTLRNLLDNYQILTPTVVDILLPTQVPPIVIPQASTAP